jgi:hypothetical protein
MSTRVPLVLSTPLGLTREDALQVVAAVRSVLEQVAPDETITGGSA